MKNPARADKVNHLIKQAQALQLRVHGHNFRSIAKALNCAISTAHNLVDTAMAAERVEISQAKADYLELELVRLDKYLAVLAKKIESGDVRAVDTALRVADRRAKLLGLDAPTKVVGGDGQTEPIRFEITYVQPKPKGE